MREWITRTVCAFAIVTVAASPALGQQRPVPDAGMFAVGVVAGAGLPTDELLKNGWFVGLSGEGYLTPRVSARAQFGGAWFDIFGHPFEGTVSPMNITGNLVYNWERGKWHPYATGGIGAYRFRFDESDLESTDTKFGANVGGGVEYFFTRSDALTGEVGVHIVPGRTDSARTSYKAHYWTIVGGYKKYF